MLKTKFFTKNIYFWNFDLLAMLNTTYKNGV